MQKHQATLSAFQFRRSKADLIQVFNEGSYLMAEYNERTGAVSWQRLLLAGQREIVEKWLRERYPVQAPPAHKPAPPPTTAEVTRTRPHRKRVSR